MKAEDKLQILKFLLMLVNSFFVILGISLFGCSAWILFDKNNFITVLSSEDNVKVAAGGLFVIGLVVVCVSMLGCIGGHLENRCLIVFYMGFLVAIILGQLFVVFLVLLTTNKVSSVLNQTVDDIINNYGANESQITWRLLDSVQYSAKCCGRINSSDWQTNYFIQDKNLSNIYPCSCFNGSCPAVPIHEIYQFGNGSNIYTMGCGEKLKDWLQNNIFVIVGMDLGLLLIQVLLIALSIHIYKNIGSKMKEFQSKKLLDAMEVNPSPEIHLSQSDQGYVQPAYDGQLGNAYDQEYAGQNIQEHAEHAPYQYQDPYYQHRHAPALNGQMYDQNYNNMYDEDAGQYQDQHYQHDTLNYTQSPNSNYDQGYAQNYDYTNNYDGY